MYGKVKIMWKILDNYGLLNLTLKYCDNVFKIHGFVIILFIVHHCYILLFKWIDKELFSSKYALHLQGRLMIQSRQIGEFKHQIDVESVANICKLNLNINENYTCLYRIFQPVKYGNTGPYHKLVMHFGNQWILIILKINYFPLEMFLLQFWSFAPRMSPK
jgi:hypothetical protein